MKKAKLTKVKIVPVPREHSDALRRVLLLVDMFIGHGNLDTLYALDGGLWTARELRKHVRAVRKLLPRESPT
jgi:hypothetical protein